jgi:hypothetical protein
VPTSPVIVHLPPFDHAPRLCTNQFAVPGLQSFTSAPNNPSYQAGAECAWRPPELLCFRSESGLEDIGEAPPITGTPKTMFGGNTRPAVLLCKFRLSRFAVDGKAKQAGDFTNPSKTRILSIPASVSGISKLYNPGNALVAACPKYHDGDLRLPDNTAEYRAVLQRNRQGIPLSARWSSRLGGQAGRQTGNERTTSDRNRASHSLRAPGSLRSTREKVQSTPPGRSAETTKCERSRINLSKPRDSARQNHPNE